MGGCAFQVLDDLELDLFEVVAGVCVVHVGGFDVEFVIRCVIL